MKKILLAFMLALVFASTVIAYPYDDPLTFRKYLTDDGRVIWSNIPKACFSKGLLTCDSLHHMYGVPVAPKKAASGSTQDKQRTSTTAANFSANHDKVINHFKSSEEPSVKDAVWASETILMVGRSADGTRQDGFAMYVCNILNDYGFKGEGVMVNVIDIVKLVKAKEWKSIGSTICE